MFDFGNSHDLPDCLIYDEVVREIIGVAAIRHNLRWTSYAWTSLQNFLFYSACTYLIFLGHMPTLQWDGVSCNKFLTSIFTESSQRRLKSKFEELLPFRTRPVDLLTDVPLSLFFTWAPQISKSFHVSQRFICIQHRFLWGPSYKYQCFSTSVSIGQIAAAEPSTCRRYFPILV